MGPVNKHPDTPPPPLQSSPPRLVGVERLHESWSSQVLVQLHTRTHACLHTHMHTRACSVHSAVTLDTPCLCTGGRTCTDRTSAAAALCARHTPPREEPRTTAVGGKVLTPTSHLSSLGWEQGFATHGHSLFPPQPPCKADQLG